MKKQRNFKFSEHVMNMLRELSESKGMSNTAVLEMLIIEAHTPTDNSSYDKIKKDFDKFEAKVERKLKKSELFWDSLDD